MFVSNFVIWITIVKITNISKKKKITNYILFKSPKLSRIAKLRYVTCTKNYVLLNLEIEQLKKEWLAEIEAEQKANGTISVFNQM